MNLGARDTINIDEAVHEFYKTLTSGNDPVSSPFKTMKDAFLWAACLGFQKGMRCSISGKKLTIFRWAQFNNGIDLPLIKALCLTEGEDVTDLAAQEKLLTTLEEFANGGIYELMSLHEQNGLWGLVRSVVER